MSEKEDFLIIHNFADLSAYLVHTYYRALKVWRRADNFPVLKPNKSADDLNNYRPKSLLCMPLKLLERLLLSRLDPAIDPQLPTLHAGFRHGRSTTDQVTLLIDDIEAGFEHNQHL